MISLFFQLLALTFCATLVAENQTLTLSPILAQDDLPFTVDIELDEFSLPLGIHSFAYAEHKDLLLFIAGRTNGMHGFNDGSNNFPPPAQNKIVVVVDPVKKKSWWRSLEEPKAGLDLAMIDTLAVTSPQNFQVGNTLYIVGGYGVDSFNGQFSTKNTLTAIDVPGLIHWVRHPNSSKKASHYIRQTSNEALRVTGGFMAQLDKHPMLLIFGQNFAGYYVPSSNGDYTDQVRRFTIDDNGHHLRVHMKDPTPEIPDPNFRRRDLNVVEVMRKKRGKDVPGIVAYSGVFTPTGGIWTVPVTISARGHTQMADPNAETTFKQGMNNYTTANAGLYSSKLSDMFTIFMGGISYGLFVEGQFETDDEIPFINQVTTIKCHDSSDFTQYLMDAAYPVIPSRFTNPGNPLLFGAGSQFFPKRDVPQYPNGVIKFDKLKKGRTHIGYIVGGIQSTEPNTNTQLDSAASEYVFKVHVTKK